MIHKLTDEKEFVKFSNEVARDKNLSYKAKGLLVTLLSLPSDWIIYQTQLHQFTKDGSRATLAAFKELIKAGYILAKRKVKPNGQFWGWEYDVYPKRQPNLQNAQTDNAQTRNV